MWHDIAIGGKTAACLDITERVRPRGAVLFLHDVDGTTLESNSVITALLDRRQLACLCPHAPGSWWLDRVWPAFDPRMSAENWLIEHVIPFMRARWQLSPGRLAVFGLGMGGQGALRLAFRHAEQFPIVAGINAILDFHELYHEGTALDEMYDSKEQCRQDTAILHIHPAQFPPHIFFCSDSADPRVLRGNDRLHEKLSALGIAHETELMATAGADAWAYANRMAPRVIEFLARGIEEQSRRLL